MTQPPLIDVGRKEKPSKREEHPFEGPRPLSTRDCADYIGQDLDFIYLLIKDGVLRAEYIQRPGTAKGRWVIPQEAWVECLKKLKWSRIPRIG